MSRSHTKRTQEVAVALNYDPDSLTQFVEFHPDPTVDAVRRLADRPPVDEDTREIIAEWLAAQTERTEDRPGGDPAGLTGGWRGHK